MPSIVSELTGAQIGLESCGKTLAARICADAIDEIKRLQAAERAAYRRGLEDAATTADEFGYAVEVSDAIRALMEDEG